MTKTRAFIQWKLKTQKRNSGNLIQTFFLLILLLMVLQLPLSQPDLSPTLSTIAPLLLFSTAFFISCLPLSGYFSEDIHDGTVEKMIAHRSLYPYSIALYAVYFLLYGLPLTLLVGAIGWAMGFSVPAQLALIASFFLSSLILMGWGGMTAILSAHGGGSSVFLSALTVLPLGIPSLLLSQTTIQAAQDGLPYESYIFMQAGLCLFTLSISIGATPTLLRQ